MSGVNIGELAKKAGRVAVVYGGQSAEREVSLLSGATVIAGLRQAGVDVLPLDAGADLAMRLSQEKPDRVFNILHGRGGEDGVIQGLLESLAIPYTGSGILGSALSMDKSKSKLLWKSLGISTADFVLLDAMSDWQALHRQFGTLVVKPVNEGSSIGMSIARSASALQQAYAEARRFDSMVLAERYIDGAEFTVAILEQQVLPAIQLDTDHDFYDYHAKYIAEDTRYRCPVDLPASQLQTLNQLALQAFAALGCRGWGRVDIMCDSNGKFYVLEVNTVPGMTGHSLVPMAARAAGMSMEELLLRVLFANTGDASKGAGK